MGNSVSSGFVQADLTGSSTMRPKKARLPVQFVISGEASERFVEPDNETL